MNDDTEQTDEPEVDRHSEAELLKQVKRHKKEADQHQGEWREEARLCYSFVAGDQWTSEEKAQLQEMMRLPVVFNRIDPMIQAVAGSEVNNRQQVQYLPRQVGDSGVNEVLTGAADYFREACDAEDEESDAFMDTIITGVGVTETRLDYIDNPEGMIRIDRREPLSMRWDPSAKKRNLADRRWSQREEWLDKETVKEQWPDKADELAASSSTGWADELSKPHDNTPAWFYEKDNTGQDNKTGKMRVIHETWYELETYHALIDPFTQQMTTMDGDQFEVLSTRLDKLKIKLQSVKKQRKKWHQVFVCGDVILEFGETACNEDPYKFITGHRDRNKNLWYGIVKAMMDPQKWANKFFSQFLHIINTNAKGGLIVEKGVSDNMRKFKQDWSKSDGITEVNDGAISRKKLMSKPAPAIPPQMSQMMEFAISSLRDVSGLNLEILGMADRVQPGVLEAQRKQAALTVLATLFDGLRRYRKEQGRLMAHYIVEYLSDGRLIRILGGDGAEKYVPLIRQPGVLEYDVVVDEAANTTNQKDKTFHVLTSLLPILDKMGAPFTPDLLDYMPIPAAMVEKWKKGIQDKMQQPPPPQPQMVSAMASMKSADANMLRAQAAAHTAQAGNQPPQPPQMDPMEAMLKQGELEMQGRELQVRGIEANAEVYKASASVEAAHAQALGLGPNGSRPAGGTTH
jgi:hypothetical protein